MLRFPKNDTAFAYKILCRISTREKQLKDTENGTTMIRSFFFSFVG